MAKWMIKLEVIRQITLADGTYSEYRIESIRASPP